MKHTAVCPKCGSEEVVRMAQRQPLMFGVWPRYYICCRCGYTETWIAQDELDKVRKHRYSYPVRRKGSTSQ